MNLDAIVLNQILMTDAFEDLQLFGHILDGPRFVWLNGDLFHGHQLAS